ncbi:hypothetical protein Poli38472_013268 [Pythium oligandrum]|uniref:C2H2-type domain-containing protein n=1 Tax=Pythium oligandrum TaxID=41045 RepID=A0A8K1C3C0_PYTOL|nr:hypothetical protein Poli38472_013268 [Pythium oligandrum]|eukprot:TMW55377.1 hypothetical protein Poli38472_013268 [Pythium oligandrum]
MADMAATTNAVDEPNALDASSPAPDKRQVLTVGDGNFSFSLAYLKQQLQRREQLRLVASSYDEYQELLEKYPESIRICTQLQELGADLLHRIDATNLRATLEACASENGEVQLPTTFDVIIFNHPHCGEENVRRHQSLLSHFYASAKELLHPTRGELHLTLADGQPERWEARERGTKAGLVLVEEIEDVDAHPVYSVDYERKRHQNGKSFHRVLLHGEKKQQDSTLFIFARPEAKRPPIAPTTTLKRKADTQDAHEYSEYNCETCVKSFKTAQGLRTHMHMVHELGQGMPSSSNGRYPCDMCDRTFKNEDARRQHQTSKHGKDPQIRPDWFKGDDNDVPSANDQLTCEICGFSFADQAAFDEHWSQLQPKAALRLACHGCKKVFDEERALRQHQNFCRKLEATHSTPTSSTQTPDKASKKT